MRSHGIGIDARIPIARIMRRAIRGQFFFLTKSQFQIFNLPFASFQVMKEFGVQLPGLPTMGPSFPIG